jgi:tetratricopeptide (TPR) repeat protein
MSDDPRLPRVNVLIQQGRYSEAEKTLKDMLSGDSANTGLLALLAEVNLQLDRFDTANQLIENAIGLSPANAHLFYIRARVAIQQDRYNDAENDVNQAIRLDPYDPHFFAMLANIKLARKQYAEALESANQALEIDPENVLALNMRSTALNKLNRKEEAFQTIEGALREDPNNAYTHANYGWGLLEKGDHKQALQHFHEALKSDPNQQYAHAGMLEAIKAGNPFYRAFLKYSFWMGNLTAKYQWGVIVGIYVAFRVIRAIAEKNEGLQPFLYPLLVLLGIVAFSTWIITPVSNLFLRFNKYGNLLLDKKEKISSNLVAGSLLLGIAGAIAYFSMGDTRFLTIAAFGVAMMLPFGTMFSPTKNKNALVYYAIAMAVLGVVAIAMTFSTNNPLNGASTLFILAFIGFQWFANFMLIKQSNY